MPYIGTAVSHLTRRSVPPEISRRNEHDAPVVRFPPEDTIDKRLRDAVRLSCQKLSTTV